MQNNKNYDNLKVSSRYILKKIRCFTSLFYFFIFYTMFKLKNIFILAMISVFTLNTYLASATSTWSTTPTSNFVLESVVAIDLNTIKATFNNELAPQVDWFSFMLNKKDDSISEVTLTWITLTWPKELTMSTETPLDDKFGYSFAVLFASDKDGNSIESWVDSTISLVFQLWDNTLTTENISLEWSNNNSTETNSEVVPMNSATETEVTTDATVEVTTTPVEEVATTENMTKVETWPTETIAIILALLAWLAFVYFRRKA